MIAPVLRPYSALKLSVMTRNSSVDSGLALSTPPEAPGTEVSLLSTPSSRKLLFRSRAPLTLTPPRALSVCDVPGDSKHQLIRVARDQRQALHLPFIDQVAESAKSPDRFPACGPPRTVTSSVTAPGISFGSTVTACATVNRILGSRKSLKPSFFTVIS